jgi:hypothetical protein
MIEEGRKWQTAYNKYIRLFNSQIIEADYKYLKNPYIDEEE